MTLTAVNLFAGIEGFGLAMHRAGIRTVAAVEINEAARGVIADRFPQTTLFTDVCEVTADALRAAGFVPDRGILTAGWPCQDLSVAGRRLGLGGARSGLFWEIVRLLADLRPRWFVLENVPGLLSAVCPCIGGGTCGGECPGDPHPVRGGACGPGRCMELHGGAMGAVLGALADLGYGVAYRVLDAQHFGVPQRRRRVVFVGCSGDWAAPAEVLLEPEGRGGDSASGGAARPGTPAVAALSASNGGADDNDATGGRLIAGALTTGATVGGGWRIGPDEAAGNQLVPVAATVSAKGTGGPSGGEAHNLGPVPAIVARYGKGTDSDATDALLPVAFDTAQITSVENRVNPKPGDPAMPLVATGQPHVAYALRADPGGTGQGHNTNYASMAFQCHGGDVGPSGTLRAGRGDVQSGVPFIAHALTAEGHDASEDGTGRGTPLVPVAFDWQTDGSDRARPNISTQRTSSLATTKRDAVAVPVAWRGRGLELGEPGVANAIRSSGDGHVGDQMGYVMTTAVRRLTPVECERLQGYPDGWTATSWGKPQSDSARYRELGNSIAVPVFAWVAMRLVAVDQRLRVVAA